MSEPTDTSFVTVEYDDKGRVVAFRQSDGTPYEGMTADDLKRHAEAVANSKPTNEDLHPKFTKRLQDDAALLAAWEAYVESSGLEPLSRVEGGNVWMEARNIVQQEQSDLADLNLYFGAGDYLTEDSDEFTKAYEAWKKKWDQLFKLTAERLRQWDILMYPLVRMTPLPTQRAYLGPTLAYPEERWAFVRIPKGTTPPPFQPFSDTSVDLPVGYHRMASAKPAILFDRASRGSANWRHDEEQGWHWLDSREPDRYRVHYHQEGESLEVLRENVQRLNPRTADVWRLIMARSLEAWPQGQLEPSSVWVDVRELAESMGYTKHKKGGFRPRDLKKVAEAIKDLSNMTLVLPLGEIVYDEPLPGQKKRTPRKLAAEEHYYALLISGRRVLRDLLGSTYPMRYLLRPGEWVKEYPRQYAPILTELTRLPTDRKTPTWAKAMGTELAFYYVQNKSSVNNVKLKVRTFLERAGLIHEADSRHASRTRDTFEDALGLLTEKGVCRDWRYEHAPEEGGYWFEAWLDEVVVIERPDMLKALEG